MAEIEYKQARIRVSREGADEIWEALFKHGEALRSERLRVLGVSDEAVRDFNQRLKQTERVLSEVLRVYKEQGWQAKDK